RHASEKRNPELLSEALSAAVAENIRFCSALTADKVAHVLDETDRRDVELLVHRHGSTAVGKRYLLRRRDDNGAGDGNGLTEAQSDIACPGRHVDDEVIEIDPLDL